MAPRPVTPDQAKAWGTAVASVSQRWSDQIRLLADRMGVKLGGTLHFADLGARQLSRMIGQGAPPDRIMSRADGLLAGWRTRSPAVFEQLRTGLFRKAARSADQTAASLSSAGVTGAPAEAARNLATLLRDLTKQSLPLPGGLGGGIDPVRAGLDQGLARFFQAARDDMAAHPDHAAALQDAGLALQKEVQNVLQGLQVIRIVPMAMSQDFARLIHP